MTTAAVQVCTDSYKLVQFSACCQKKKEAFDDDQSYPSYYELVQISRAQYMMSDQNVPNYYESVQIITPQCMLSPKKKTM